MTCRIVLGNCLNLANAKDMAYLCNCLKDLRDDGVVFAEENLVAKEGHPLVGERVYTYLDHRIIDSYSDYADKAFDAVLGVFNNGIPIWEGSNIHQHDSIQLAVRDQAVRGITVENITHIPLK